ncbi:pyridoxamine 5'-phosphate oxidase family protein [Klenkia brasiliensis]|uniref:Pyridoxamine 5'-phosphate oxidase n=1 Tax=Klenkia brasiliensis TaxID=333142 RepID=A0A1G7S9Y1_9ACTN|nr:pyridoxamine 5'-phosphate oxidase family protein [Klenkia brasiliensis]SDG19808.1 hypothetical protein SAMN05660324_1936 [Klenkia brasiliensis]
MSTETLHQVPPTSTTPPPAVVAFLDGADLENKVGTAVGVLTADEDSWPHHAQLSAGEVLLAHDGAVALLLHDGSATTGNLRRDGRITLVLAAGGANHEMRFQVAEQPVETDLPLAAFTGHLRVAREHKVPYAEITSGVTYRLHDPVSVVSRWERQVALLRGLLTSQEN